MSIKDTATEFKKITSDFKYSKPTAITAKFITETMLITSKAVSKKLFFSFLFLIFVADFTYNCKYYKNTTSYQNGMLQYA